MPIIVPIEENNAGLTTATDAKFRAPDYSGSGPEAPGARLVRLGDSGQQLASEIEERRRRAVEAIAAAMLDDRHQGNIDDAAAKRAYIDYSDGSAKILHGDDGLFNQKGADAHGAFADTVAVLADTHDKAIAGLDNIQRNVVAPAMNDRLRRDVERAANHVRQQGVIEQRLQSAELQRSAARDATAHADDPDLFDHHIATGENTIRQQAKVDNLSHKVLARQIADYRSGVHTDTIDALIRQDPAQAKGWYARFGDELNERDRPHVLAAITGVAAENPGSGRIAFMPSDAGDPGYPNVETNGDFGWLEDDNMATPPAALSASLESGRVKGAGAGDFQPPTTPPPGWDPALDAQIDHLAAEISTEIRDQPDAEKIEHSAFIWRGKDGVLHRTALTGGSGSNAWLTAADFNALRIPDDAQIVAIIHNHPSLHWNANAPSMGVPGSWVATSDPKATARPSALDYDHWYKVYVAQRHASPDNFRAYMVYNGQVHKYNLWQQDPGKTGGSYQANWAVESNTYNP